MPALLTAMRLVELGGLSVLGSVTAPAYWLKSGRPTDVEIAARAIPLYAALSYDGRIAFTPSDPLDADIVAAVNAHQRTDKGFGPALGIGRRAARLRCHRRQWFGLGSCPELSKSARRRNRPWRVVPRHFGVIRRSPRLSVGRFPSAGPA